MKDDRYQSPYELPKGRLRELLTVLGEEAAEIIVATSKAQRFGLADGYPGAGTTNEEDISCEVGDLLAVVQMLYEMDCLSPALVERAKMAKREKLDRFLQHPA